MQTPSFSSNTPKRAVKLAIREWIQSADFTPTLQDFERPWGGFFYIDEGQIADFIHRYFSDIETELAQQVAAGQKLTPKILVVAPGVKLSWQYHHRRSEEWFVLGENPVGVMTSNTDTPPDEPVIYAQNERVIIGLGVRHRLMGLENWGVVTEIWKHEDTQHPSDEEDIVRVQDDFDRK